MSENVGTGKVLIVSISESFLAKSLIMKLTGAGIPAVFAKAEIGELEKYAQDMELVILFVSEDSALRPEPLVYLKDLVSERDAGLILITEDSGYEAVRNIIPEQNITEIFGRPLDIDALLRRVSSYMDENTGDRRMKTILIVDDDITYMRTVYEWLKGFYHVGMASNGVQAITYLAKNKADLVLLDYEMPVANGPQVLSMLKNDAETGQIPVMFLTGHSDRESVLSAVGLKPADYLLKTIDRETLLKKLSDFFIEKMLKG